jgi:hypothetical protein
MKRRFELLKVYIAGARDECLADELSNALRVYQSGEYIPLPEHIENSLLLGLDYILPNDTDFTTKEWEDKLTQAVEDEAIEVINEKFESDIASITSSYPQAERETWGIQLSQAKDYLNTKDEDANAFITTLAKANSVGVEGFAVKVINKAKAYEDAVAKALASKQKALKELEQMR